MDFSCRLTPTPSSFENEWNIYSLISDRAQIDLMNYVGNAVTTRTPSEWSLSN